MLRDCCTYFCRRLWVDRVEASRLRWDTQPSTMLRHADMGCPHTPGDSPRYYGGPAGSDRPLTAPDGHQRSPRAFLVTSRSDWCTWPGHMGSNASRVASSWPLAVLALLSGVTVVVVVGRWPPSYTQFRPSEHAATQTHHHLICNDNHTAF